MSKIKWERSVFQTSEMYKAPKVLMRRRICRRCHDAMSRVFRRQRPLLNRRDTDQLRVRDDGCIHPTIFSNNDANFWLMSTLHRVRATTHRGRGSLSRRHRASRTVVLNRMTSDGVGTASSPWPRYSKSDTGTLLMTEWCPFCYCSSLH